MKDSRNKLYLGIMFTLLSAALPMFSISSVAAVRTETVAGQVYEFGEKESYPFSNTKEFGLPTDGAQTYGKLSISGDIEKVSMQNGVPCYCIGNGNLDISYTYDDKVLNASEDEWHLEKDTTKVIDTKKLNGSIGKGTILLQTSRDGINWIDDFCSLDVFSKIPVQTGKFYTTTDVQKVSGSYFRVIVAYETKIRTKAAVVPLFDEYEHKKSTELYRFYICNSSNEHPEPKTMFRIGDTVASDKSFTSSNPIGVKDVHYHWTLGDFYIGGYTDESQQSDGSYVFLKNVGDEVSLWYKLTQDINQLNGKTNLRVYDNDTGYDEYFQVPRQDFGKGTLIIKYNDYRNTPRTETYVNYLEANTSLGADTRVQLFEEGDYEVSLDYEIIDDELVDQFHHYKNSFKFSVRNSNCMVFPFDVITGDELTNSSVTPNGFRLDLANSRYLDINIKKQVLKNGGDSLSEDTRFNKSAKDGDEYTEEGVYVIKVKNKYTNEETTKTIYVGKDGIIKAHMKYGYPISEIREKVANGAVISDDGTIIIPEMKKELGALKISFETDDIENKERETIFHIVLTEPLTGEYGSEDNRIVFVSGKAEISLKNGESISISDIPAGLGYTVSSTEDEKYSKSYSVNGKKVVEASGLIHTDSTENVAVSETVQVMPEPETEPVSSAAEPINETEVSASPVQENEKTAEVTKAAEAEPTSKSEIAPETITELETKKTNEETTLAVPQSVTTTEKKKVSPIIPIISVIIVFVAWAFWKRKKETATAESEENPSKEENDK